METSGIIIITAAATLWLASHQNLCLKTILCPSKFRYYTELLTMKLFRPYLHMLLRIAAAAVTRAIVKHYNNIQLNCSCNQPITNFKLIFTR